MRTKNKKNKKKTSSKKKNLIIESIIELLLISMVSAIIFSIGRVLFLLHQASGPILSISAALIVVIIFTILSISAKNRIK